MWDNARNGVETIHMHPQGTFPEGTSLIFRINVFKQAEVDIYLNGVMRGQLFDSDALNLNILDPSDWEWSGTDQDGIALPMRGTFIDLVTWLLH